MEEGEEMVASKEIKEEEEGGKDEIRGGEMEWAAGEMRGRGRLHSWLQPRADDGSIAMKKGSVPG